MITKKQLLLNLKGLKVIKTEYNEKWEEVIIVFSNGLILSLVDFGEAQWGIDNEDEMTQEQGV